MLVSRWPQHRHYFLDNKMQQQIVGTDSDLQTGQNQLLIFVISLLKMLEDIKRKVDTLLASRERGLAAI